MAKADGKKAKKADGKVKGAKKKIKVEVDHGVEVLSKFAEHPLVSDLLAVGAMAAVAAIAEKGVAARTGNAESSRKAVKAAGKAAAAAIGARLLKEVGDFAGKAATRKA